MSLEDLTSDSNPLDERTKWIGVYIGVLAVLLAIGSVGGGNVEKDAARYNLDATNNWAFFQAKNMRRTSIRLAADELEIMLAANPGMPSAARAAIEAKIAEYKAMDQKLTTDPERQEGLDELFVRGKELEARRDAALAQDPYFDWSGALLQIAIVIASVSIISGSGRLLVVSGALGVAGTILMLNGFLMLFSLPWLG